MEATLPPGRGAWLVYADSFHPSWHATLDGRAVPIAEANLAFKAVRVEGGRSRVGFVFHDGIRTVGAQMLALLAGLFAGNGLAAIGALAIRRDEARALPGSPRP